MYILLVVLGFAEISVTARELHSVSKGACGGYKTSNKAVENGKCSTHCGFMTAIRHCNKRVSENLRKLLSILQQVQ